MSSLWIKDFLCYHMLKCFFLFQNRLIFHYVCTTFFFSFISMECLHLQFWGKCCNEHGSVGLMLSALIIASKEKSVRKPWEVVDMLQIAGTASWVQACPRSPISHIRVLYLQLYFIKAVSKWWNLKVQDMGCLSKETVFCCCCCCWVIKHIGLKWH